MPTAVVGATVRESRARWCCRVTRRGLLRPRVDRGHSSRDSWRGRRATTHGEPGTNVRLRIDPEHIFGFHTETEERLAVRAEAGARGPAATRSPSVVPSASSKDPASGARPQRPTAPRHLRAAPARGSVHRRAPRSAPRTRRRQRRWGCLSPSAAAPPAARRPRLPTSTRVRPPRRRRMWRLARAAAGRRRRDRCQVNTRELCPLIFTIAGCAGSRGERIALGVEQRRNTGLGGERMSCA